MQISQSTSRQLTVTAISSKVWGELTGVARHENVLIIFCARLQRLNGIFGRLSGANKISQQANGMIIYKYNNKRGKAMTKCKASSCNREVWARGYCGTHYQRIRSGAIVETEASIRQYRRHGMFDHPLYKLWQGMKNRCENKNSDSYKYYGARGITICERWHSFDNFVADVGDRPPGRSLDRINNDGDYEPGNVRWATQLEQVKNSRPKSKKAESVV